MKFLRSVFTGLAALCFATVAVAQNYPSPTFRDVTVQRNLIGGNMPVRPSLPDTVESYYTITSVAGDNTLILTGANFTAADVGKLISCENIGPHELRLVTSITARNSSTSIEVANAPTQTMTAVPRRCFYGTDQATNLQGAFDSGLALSVGTYVPGGTYLTSQPLTCLQPSLNNNANRASALCQLDAGANIIAMSTMTCVLTYGGINPDYSQYIHDAIVSGGMIDGNFVANYGVCVPHFLHMTRKDQRTKNTLLAGVRYGATAAPSTSAGSQDIGTYHARDMQAVVITSVTKANPPVVTTTWHHGFTSGRVVSFASTVGMTELDTRWFRITVTGPTTFTLDNTDSTSWGTFTSGQVFMTMPSMDITHIITGITNANPGVVTTSTTTEYVNGDQVFIADVGGMAVDGVYTVAGKSGNTFQLSGVNTTSLGTFAGTAQVIKWRDPETIEKGIYYENASDSQVTNFEGYGFRLGVWSKNGGYDQKHIASHYFNYPQNGELLAAIHAVGDNSIMGVQIDCPARFGIWLTGVQNTVMGSRINCAGFAINANNHSSFIRLDSGGYADAYGNGMKGDTGKAFLAEVSRVGAIGSYGVPNYCGYGTQARLTSFIQPNCTRSNLQVYNPIGNADATVRSLASSQFTAYGTTSGYVGTQMFSSNGFGGFNTISNAGVYTGTPIKLKPSGVVVMDALPTNCTGQQAGTLWKNSNVVNLCP